MSVTAYDTIVLDGTCTLETAVDGEYGEFITVHTGADEYYKGPTNFTPSWETQVAETANTVVLKDITFNPIQTYEVSNEAGGITFSI